MNNWQAYPVMTNRRTGQTEWRVVHRNIDPWQDPVARSHSRIVAIILAAALNAIERVDGIELHRLFGSSPHEKWRAVAKCNIRNGAAQPFASKQQSSGKGANGATAQHLRPTAEKTQ